MDRIRGTMEEKKNHSEKGLEKSEGDRQTDKGTWEQREREREREREKERER